MVMFLAVYGDILSASSFSQQIGLNHDVLPVSLMLIVNTVISTRVTGDIDRKNYAGS